MISYEEALELIEKQTTSLGEEVVPLKKLLHRVLATPLVAPFDMPQFDNSQVDGFAVKADDLKTANINNPVHLKLAGKVKAGSAVDLPFKNGETVRIFTGAPIPKSANAVVMQEDCLVLNDGFVSTHKPVKEKQNIRFSGAEFKAGTQLLPAGTVVTPPVIGLLASLGIAEFPVAKLPDVTVITTGDELVAPGNPVLAGQIYDANSPALESALASLGLINITTIAVKDNAEDLKQACLKALESELVILSGGVSVGDYDFVKDVLEQIGVETVFWQVSIKPGRPIYFGKHEKGIVFGLPGNTVSTLVTFHQFVKIALQKMVGITNVENKLHGVLKAHIKKHNEPRLVFARGVYTTSEKGALIVEPTRGQESNMLSGLANANCLINLPLKTDYVDIDDVAKIDQLTWKL
jgi:molybdopterin molybdotransferase